MKGMTAAEEVAVAKGRGWESYRDRRRGGKWCRFQKGIEHVYMAGIMHNGARVPGWARADLIDRHYTNHRFFASLEDALSGKNAV